MGNSWRKVPFSTLPENAEGESGADIVTEGHRMQCMKRQFHTGLKRDRTSIPSAVIASASTEAQQHSRASQFPSKGGRYEVFIDTSVRLL